MDWLDDAQCEGTESNVFFTDTVEKVQQAKSLCRICTVRKSCLDLAIRENQPYGVWGGLTPQERKRYREEMADDTLITIRQFALELIKITGKLVQRHDVYYWIRKKGMPHHKTQDGYRIDLDQAMIWAKKEGLYGNEEQ